MSSDFPSPACILGFYCIMYFSSSSSPHFLNMEGSGVKMKEPTFVIFWFTTFHHQTFSLYSLRVFSFSFALWMCNFMFCYLTLILTTVSREATNQQFPKSRKHIGQIRLTLLYIYDIFPVMHHSSFVTHSQPPCYSLSL